MRSLRYLSDGEDEETVIVIIDGGTEPGAESSVDDVGDSVASVAAERFALRVDDALRRAVLPPEQSLPLENEPSGQAEPAARVEEIVLSPREIQVRVRAGEDPQELAAETGANLSRIMRFAEAVVAERARVADEARRSRARREGDGVLVPFGETVDRRFAVHGIEANGVGWDSYRREDGTWVVIATWHSDGIERRAHWAFSLGTRTLLPADEAAGDLLSDRPLRPVVQAVPDMAAVVDSMTGVSKNGDSANGDMRNGDIGDLPPVTAGSEVFDQEAEDFYPPEPLRRPEPVPQQEGPRPPPRRDSVPPLRLADPLPIFGDVDPDEDDIIPFDSYEEPADEPAPVAHQQQPVRRGSGRGKAAREQTKIPSWDDILLGVRRKSD